MVSDDDLGEVVDILLVEPNEGDVRLFTEEFRNAKLANELHTAGDGETALEFLYRQGEYEDAPAPDLIILEPNLPGTSGREMLDELEADPVLSQIPIVVLTSSVGEKQHLESNGIDADAYIRKPVEAEEFLDFVTEVEEFWLAIVEDAPDA
jgi:CheY-like chemotaxis protein